MRKNFAPATLGYLGLGISVSLIVAALSIWSGSVWREFLIVLLAVLIPLPVVWRVLARRFDPFEPIVILSFCLFVLFVLRPVAHLAYGEMVYGTYSLEPGFNKALLIALVGVGALYVGYFVRAGEGGARRLRPLPTSLKPVGTIAFAMVLIGIGAVLYGLYSQQVGGLGTIKNLLSGRDPQEGRYLTGGTIYFLYGPFLTIPATLLLLEAAAAKQRALFVLVTGIGTALALVFITAPRGDRLWLLLLVMGVLTLPYLRAGTRPRLRTLVLVMVVFFGFGITFLSAVRVPIAREGSPANLLKRAATNPLHGWKDFILGGDTEMFSVMALETELVPSKRPHEPGLTLVSLATTWIPRAFYENKPDTTDDKVYAMLFPEYSAVTRGGTAPSYFGGLYYDSGLIAVVIGSFLFGVLARGLFEYLRLHPASVGARLVYASTLPFLVVLLRGNPTDSIGRMAYIVVPIVVALWLTGTREGARGPSVRSGRSEFVPIAHN